MPFLISRRWLLTIATAGTLACDVTAWRRAFEAYRREYPRAEAADLYKLAHQGILGSEHAVPDTASVRAWMQREIAGLPAHAEPSAHHAPFAEPLPPDGRFVRVHLRPFLARGGDANALLRAFIATANGARGDTAQFACAERALSSPMQGRVVTGGLELIRERRRTGFEAAHHSPAFEAAYAPAYRVISASWLARLTDGSSLSPARRD